MPAVTFDYQPNVHCGTPFPARATPELEKVLKYALKLPKVSDLQQMTESSEVFLPIYRAIASRKLFSLYGCLSKRYAHGRQVNQLAKKADILQIDGVHCGHSIESVAAQIPAWSIH